MRKIDTFTGDNRFLSNFSYVELDYEGIEYQSVESAYQAAKTLNKEERLFIAGLDAKQAKSLGKKIELREDWEQVKLGIMEELLRKKFVHPTLKSLLLNTGGAVLEEGNWWGDTFWGVCEGEGENHLGKLLMKIRKELEDDIVNGMILDTITSCPED